MSVNLELLLIEDDISAQQDLLRYINTKANISIILSTNNSYKAIEFIKKRTPHVVILDLELTNGSGNGLTFLHDLSNLGLTHKPFILITTNNSSTTIYNHARNYGADFILYKHQKDYSAKMVIDFIISIENDIMNVPESFILDKREKQTQEQRLLFMTQKIHSELNKIGISPKLRGFQYLCSAIILYMADRSNITQKIAQQYKKSEPSVERAMQNAINKAWTTTDTDALLMHYTASIRSDKGVPTLLEFVAYYANMLSIL